MAGDAGRRFKHTWIVALKVGLFSIVKYFLLHISSGTFMFSGAPMWKNDKLIGQLKFAQLHSIFGICQVVLAIVVVNWHVIIFILVLLKKSVRQVEQTFIVKEVCVIEFRAT